MHFRNSRQSRDVINSAPPLSVAAHVETSWCLVFLPFGHRTTASLSEEVKVEPLPLLSITIHVSNSIHMTATLMRTSVAKGLSRAQLLRSKSKSLAAAPYALVRKRTSINLKKCALTCVAHSFYPQRILSCSDHHADFELIGRRPTKAEPCECKGIAREILRCLVQSLNTAPAFARLGSR